MVSDPRHSLAWFSGLLATFLVAEIKCQSRSSLKKGLVSVGGETSHYVGEGTGAGEMWGGGGKGRGWRERMRIIDAQHFLRFIPFGNPSSYGGSSELVFSL